MEDGITTCPSCGGSVREEATLCRHCRAPLRGGDPLREPWVRDPANKQLAGVAAMVAGKFRISPTLVRAAFLLSILFGTIGFWIYVVLWAATPLGTTDAPFVRLVRWVETTFFRKKPKGPEAIERRAADAGR